MALSSMDGKTDYFSVKDIALIAMLTGILFIQEELLTFVPNVQLTIFLLYLYSKKIGFVRTSIIVTIHVILDNLVMGSFSLIYTPAMFIGWMFIPIFVCTIGRKIENPFALASLSIINSFIYCWMFVLPNYLMYNINPIAYLASDIVFEVILAIVGFITIVVLYKPCSIVFDRFGITRVK